jgi:hypothetical protein
MSSIVEKDDVEGLKVNPSKYAMQSWDGSKTSFDRFRRDTLQMTLELRLAYMTDAGRGMFEELGVLAAAAKVAGMVFSTEFKDHDPLIWSTALAKRENGRVMARMTGLEIRILKNAFGPNFTDGKKCGYGTAASFKEACEIAQEDFLLEINKTLIKKWRDAIFRTGRAAGDNAHLSWLRALLFSPDLVLLFEGKTPADIAKWFANPWLMPAVVVWC